jgi:hypothetical protein
MIRRLTAAVVFCVLLGASLGASLAPAAAPRPGWSINTRLVPSNFSSTPGANFSDGYNLVAVNDGSRPTDGSLVTVTDRLPAGIVATEVTGYDFGPGFEQGPGSNGGQQKPVALSCALGSVVTCTDSAPVPPGDSLYIDITVQVAPGTPSGEMNTVGVSGGGAPAAYTIQPTPVSTALAPYGFESLRAEATGLDGLVDTQAGDRAYEYTTSYYLNVNHYRENHAQAAEDAKDFVFDLPAGFVGDPQVVRKCPQILVHQFKCPPSTQIGVAHVSVFAAAGHDTLHGQTSVPIYNVVPDAGTPAQFMFAISVGVPVNLFVNVSQETNYGVRVLVSGVPQVGNLTGASLTFFGEPLNDPNVYNQSVGADAVAFLQNPVDCAAGPLQTKASSDSWQHPGGYLANGSPNLSDPNWKTVTTTTYPSMTGCEMLQFNPSIQVTPDTTRADEPTGVTVDLHVPQSTDLTPALATPELKDATVTLPSGMSLSASASDGLQACSNGQIASESTEPASCPDASVLGTVEVFTPLLEKPLTGQVYLGTPECDPCSATDASDGREFRIFIQAAGNGVRIKKEGRIYANQSTGQLTTRFTDNPDLPFEDVKLHFKGGLRAGLATPQECGSVMSSSDLVPWSTPITPDATPSSSFNVDWDGNGGACPAVPGLNPGFSAGTSNPNAGQFSPLTLTFSRQDREQDLSGIQVRTPPGLLGTLAGIPLCGEPQASLGTCSADSRIGSMTVAAGPGSHPFYEQGSLYLTGPYKGAPFGLSIVVPTVAGPFNLGNIVVRAQIDVDRHTTALTVTSDPLPQVIDGIPLRLRTANVTVDRPGFIFNPTNCAQQQITATISGAQGAQAHLSAPFAVAGCAGLPFAPKFKVSSSGHTSRANGASLDARLIYPRGAQSNIAKVKVALPKQLPSRLTTLQKACPAATFEANPAACPKGAIVGIARATSPVLPVTLTGPAYFVSHGGEAFPNLIVVLQGYGVRIDLIGDTFINKAGITSSTFTNVPDVQVSSFELYLPQGPGSALAANGDLCKSKLVMPTSFIAQDGAQLKQTTRITVTGCTKAKTARKARKASKARRASRSHAVHGRGN